MDREALKMKQTALTKQFDAIAISRDAKQKELQAIEVQLIELRGQYQVYESLLSESVVDPANIIEAKEDTDAK